ncbi:MAG: hypothetical protein JSV37_09950, partial [Anaerolineaceae bacterium]
TGGLEGLSDLRDESDRQGMRVVLELSKTADSDKVLAELYRRTPMQTTFSVIMLALVEGEPRLLNLKQALRVYLEHRLEVTERRVQFDLAKAREREHILAGLRIALSNLDDVIKMIRTAKDVDQARQRLQRRLKLTSDQANAILDMPLRRLSSLERRKIDQEYRELRTRIKELEGLLRSKKKMRMLIVQELSEVKSKYGDRRRTQIVETTGKKRTQAALTATDLAPTKETWVTISRDGLIRRTPSARLPRLSGRDAPRLVIGATGRDTLYLFDTKGFGAATAVHTLPECDNPKDGVPIAAVTPFNPEAEIVAGIALPPKRRGKDLAEGFLIFGTAAGMVKKSERKIFPGPSAKTFRAIKVAKSDELRWVHLTSGEQELCLVTNAGMAIRFHEADVRPMGLSAGGVYGIRISDKKTRVVSMCVVAPRSDLLLVTENGLAKRTILSKFPRQGRHGKGVLAWKSGEDIRLAGAVLGQANDRVVAHLQKGAARSIRFSDAPRRLRNASGKTLIEVKKGNRVTLLTPVVSKPVSD